MPVRTRARFYTQAQRKKTGIFGEFGAGYLFVPPVKTPRSAARSFIFSAPRSFPETEKNKMAVAVGSEVILLLAAP